MNLLDEKGIVIDEPFINKWLYARIDNVFNAIIVDIDDEEVSTNRFLIYNKIKNEQLDFQSNLEKGLIKQQGNIKLIYKIKSIDEEITLKYLKKGWT